MTQPPTPAPTDSRLMAAREITQAANISRSHLYGLVSEGRFPAPALRIGARYTRWKAQDVYAWLNDPQGWIAANMPAPLEAVPA